MIHLSLSNGMNVFEIKVAMINFRKLCFVDRF